MEEDEVELMDYLYIIWKRKWLIIIPTLFLVLFAVLISFLLPQRWKVDAVLVPSKFFVQTASGQFEEVVVVDPKQIAGQINEATYNSLIAAELGIDTRRFPKLRSENLRDTKLVLVSVRDKDIERAKSILSSLFNFLKGELDKKAEIEIKGIDSEIKSNEIEKLRIEEEIKVLKKKLNIVIKRKNEIEREMGETKKGIELLEEEQRLNLRKENRSEAESLGMLLYSNQIQLSIRYYNTLNEILNEKRIEVEEINLSVENNEKKIKQLENTIANLNERKGRIDYTQLIKKPTSSLRPVSPNKKLIVLITGVLSLMVFIIIAFFLEYLEKQKLKS